MLINMKEIKLTDRHKEILNLFKRNKKEKFTAREIAIDVFGETDDKNRNQENKRRILKMLNELQKMGKVIQDGEIKEYDRPTKLWSKL